jgi:hypothetical protein
VRRTGRVALALPESQVPVEHLLAFAILTMATANVLWGVDETTLREEAPVQYGRPSRYV